MGQDNGIDTHTTIASDSMYNIAAVTHVTPLPCHYCDQAFTNRIELIAHMDKESSAAIAEYERKRKQAG